MNKNGYDYIYDLVFQKFKDSGFTFEREQDEIVIYNEKLSFKIVCDSDNNEIYLEVQENNKESIDQWNRLSLWLFDENSSNKDMIMISDDFIDTISKYSKVGLDKVISKKVSKGRSSNTLFFANRMMNIFPELKDEISFEKEHYSEFRGAEFAVNNILPKILMLLSDGKDTKKIEKLFKLIGDLYLNSSLEVRSLISIGILNGIEGEKEISIARKFMSNELQKAWDAALKYKGKQLKKKRLDLKSKFNI